MKFKVVFHSSSQPGQRQKFYREAGICGYIRKPKKLDSDLSAQFEARGDHPKLREMLILLVVSRFFHVIQNWKTIG